ncbi:MAG: hypothetical protein ACOYO7_09305, partial [Phycisphaerales bacterium]
MRIPLACVVTMAASVGCASTGGTANAPHDSTTMAAAPAEPRDVPHEAQAVMEERGEPVVMAAAPTTPAAP